MEKEIETKQALICRTDLGMSAGKAATACAHASTRVLIDLMNNTETNEIDFNEDTIDAIEHWSNGQAAKIALRINSVEELLDIFDKARYMKIPCSLITDNGKTEFNGVKTIVSAAIGPDHADKINKLTGHLKLL
jgi:PTH2 family peptidyl-tRNA hydrolase